MTQPNDPSVSETSTERATLDLVEERLRVSKRMVDQGGVRVTAVPETVEEAVEVEDRVPHELAGPVVSDVAAAVCPKHRDTAAY